MLRSYYSKANSFIVPDFSDAQMMRGANISDDRKLCPISVEAHILRDNRYYWTQQNNVVWVA